MTSGRGRALALACVAAAILYALIFAQTARFGFVWDDASFHRTSLFKRPLVEALRFTEQRRLTEDRRVQPGTEAHDSYRPLQILSHAIDLRVFGDASAPMHLHSALLGLLAAVLAFLVARRCFDSVAAGALMGALFALHPIHVEPHAYLSARADLLAGIFSLVSLWCAFRAAAVTPVTDGARRWLFAGLAGAAQLLSLFSKEANIGLPLVVLLLAHATGKNAWRPAAALAVATASYFVLRRWLVGGAGVIVGGEILWYSVRDFPGLALQYLGVFLLPFDLSVCRPLATGFRWAGWGLTLAATALLRRRDPGVRLLAASFLVVVILIGPAAVAVHAMGAVADRYAYLALFGLGGMLLALARIAARLQSRIVRRALAGGLALWALLLVGATAIQVGVWRDDRTLFVHALAQEPDSAQANYHVGHLYAVAGDWKNAAPLFERAAAFEPQDARANNSLGVAYLNLGRLDQAEARFRRGLVLSNEQNPRAWFNLAEVYLRRGPTERSRACAAVARTLALDAAHPRANAYRKTICKD